MTTQNWVPTDRDHAQKEYEDWEASKTRTVKPPVGKSIWFVCPARAGASQGASPFRKGQYIHFLRDPQAGEVFAVGICPSKTYNTPCCVEPYLRSMKATGNPADIELAEKMAAKEHILVNAIRLDVEPAKMEILQIPMGVYKDLNKILRDRNDGFDFTNPTNGKSVIIERVGTGKNDTEYSVRLSNSTLSLEKIGKLGLLSDMADLDKVYEDLDQHSVAGVLAGDASAPRDVGPRAPTGRQVEAPQEQRQLPASGAGASAPVDAEEMAEDPVSGEMVPKSSLK